MTNEELLQVIEEAARNSVTELNLSGYGLTILPPEIGKLSNLRSLNIRENQLSSLPSEIGKLSNLRSLNLSSNQLSSLAGEIGQLSELQTLDLSFNQLSSLAGEIGQLSELQTLDLSFNQLSSLPGEIGQLSELQTLDLSFNQLSSLPGEIGQLLNLHLLELRSNKLRSLPGEIGQLGELQTLDLSFNQLSNLPYKIAKLINLQSVDISNNQLSSLPYEIEKLIKLETFNLRSNQLNSLPLEIRQLPNLKKLDLRSNPLPISPEILGTNKLWEDPGDVNEVLNFYFRVQDPNESEPFCEAKLLIVGEENAGKTSFAKKIQNENYYLQPKEKSTEGIDIIPWHFIQNNSNKDFRVNIWDFGGQEIYHKTHQFFLTERSLYALVVDTREENIDLNWWLNIVKLCDEDSPVIIIKNEKDNRECKIDEGKLHGEFTNLKEFLTTNLADNRGLPEIKQAIQYYISRLPHVYDPLPKIWLRVRSALENDLRNYITLEEYKKLCQVNNLTDTEDMLRLSRYLHDIGVCLHYQDDSLLEQYVILKPKWVTAAVYKVLDNEKVQQNKGEFSKNNLKDIWKNKEYTDMRGQLLELMKRFRLCYEIPYSPSNYIAPQLLSDKQPKYNWDKTHNLILRYKYEFMPKGIITCLIATRHDLIEQKLVWRNGVVLNKDETRAEVIEDYERKEIKIRVTGITKKVLLGIVNDELHQIHQSFKKLSPQILVPCNCKSCTESQTPHDYLFENLYKRLKAGRYKVECENSYEMVDVRRLIDDVNLLPVEVEQKCNPQVESFQNQAMINYHDFQILVTADRKIRASSAEQGEEWGELRLEMNEIDLALPLIEQRQTNAKLIKGLGSKLYQALFPVDIRGQLRATIAGAQANGYEVRLSLVFNSPELAALPWEFLYDEATNTFLANNTQTVLSRYVDVPLQKRELKAASQPLKVLLVISSPSNLPPLDEAGEESLIRDALAKHIDSGTIELDVLQEATIRNINQKLHEKPYNVLHFIGHGKFENNKGYIALVDTDGKYKLLDDEGFANFFLGNRSLGLAVLNSCQGAAVSSNQAFAGIAPNLVRRGIPAVVAMQYEILDTTAKLFADEFYRTLALGWPVDAAIQTTRNAISMEVGLDKPDFATPVLYMRAKDGIILAKEV
ncbi:Miro domain-containing protein [Tolypothrix tenuis PCC 7101]|uniref:non-specific serine/threonine protein kinase n=1 Tax=Tolypothrix tenuis PCC 7101 TaxID=231146 RepID=A0A1Z4MZH6_9CYAN|nr:Miro domain-containing protein [Tolypothrix tenuis PCC 7101]BAZ77185.1 Miro domain-containing protein [Aulosira laxa NIES-50]